jgi:holo-[acyl-carrier protein] synthase
MIGLGVDLVEVDRLRRAMARHASIEARLFTDIERADARRSRDPATHFAARFAAKEAAMKAMGVGLGAVRWHDIEVRRDNATGAPHLHVEGRAAARAHALGVTSWHVSLTHTATAAAAVVVAL